MDSKVLRMQFALCTLLAQLLARAKRPHGRRGALTAGTNCPEKKLKIQVKCCPCHAGVCADGRYWTFIRAGVYLPLWEKERTKIQNMSVSVFKSKYDFKMPIEEDDDGRERKYLDSVKDIWITDGTEMKSFLEAKYYLRGARRSANESLTWAGKFGSLKPEKNDSDYGEDLGDEEDEGEEEEGDEGDEATAA
jgi:hypothetical protein